MGRPLAVKVFYTSPEIYSWIRSPDSCSSLDGGMLLFRELLGKDLPSPESFLVIYHYFIYVFVVFDAPI